MLGKTRVHARTTGMLKLPGTHTASITITMWGGKRRGKFISCIVNGTSNTIKSGIQPEI